jgi:uncharacterized protein YqeY
MLRDKLNAAMKEAMKSGDKHKLSTVRLILAAIKDRDIATRGADSSGSVSRDEVIGDQAIIELLHKMVKQRKESIRAYEEGGRMDLVEQEQAEIAVIEEFLPPQMSEEDTKKRAAEAVAALGASGLKDVGKVMAYLKEHHAGSMDFAIAGAEVRRLLS